MNLYLYLALFCNLQQFSRIKSPSRRVQLFSTSRWS